MKYLLALLVVTCFGTYSYSQLSIKPAIGINLTDASKDPESGTVTAKLGWQLGASAVLGRKFYIEPGVFYQVKSMEFSSSTDQELNFDNTMTGFRIPVSIGYHLLGKEASDINVRAFVGGSGFFITSVEGNISEDDIASPQWGVYAGAGIDFWLMFVDLKYQWSLSDITRISNFDIGQTRTFFVNIGFRLRI